MNSLLNYLQQTASGLSLRFTPWLLCCFLFLGMSKLQAQSKNILFIVDEVSGVYTGSNSDQAIENRLIQLGHSVSKIRDNGITAAAASGQDLIVISGSVQAGKINGIFTQSALPLINCEAFLMQDLGLSTNEGTSNGVQQLTIQDPAHPLATGLSGTVNVLSQGAKIGRANPGGSALFIAEMSGGKYMIIGQEAGSPLSIAGQIAPARRVGLFIDNEVAEFLTADGWALFDAAVEWACETEGDPPASIYSLPAPIELLQESNAIQGFKGILLPNEDVMFVGYTDATDRSHTVDRYTLSGTQLPAWIELINISGPEGNTSLARVKNLPGGQSGIQMVNPASIDLSTYSIASTTQTIHQDQDLLIARVTPEGNVLYSRTIGSSFFESWPSSKGGQLSLTSDGQLMIACTMNKIKDEYGNPMLVKVDIATGQIISSHVSEVDLHADEITDLHLTQDGQFLTTGPRIGDNAGGFVMKTDHTGSQNLGWGNGYNGGGQSFFGQSVLETNDGNILAYGYALENGIEKAKLLKLSAIGQTVLFNLKLDNGDPTCRIFLQELEELDNGDFIAVGHSECSSNTSAFAARFSSTGTLYWSQSYDLNILGGDPKATELEVLPDGTLLLAGYTGEQSFTMEVDLASGSLVWAKALNPIYSHRVMFFEQRSNGQILLGSHLQTGDRGIRLWTLNKSGIPAYGYGCEVQDIIADVSENNAGITVISETGHVGELLDEEVFASIATIESFKAKGKSTLGTCPNTIPDCASCAITFAAPDPTKNYVLSISPRVPISDPTQIGSLTEARELAQSVVYLDGLGRTIQEIAVGASPDCRDAVAFHAYDPLGREPKAFLPFTLAGNAGAFVSNPETAQLNFFATDFPEYDQNSHIFYAETAFENSPLSRVIEQGAPGDSWQLDPGSHGIQGSNEHTLTTQFEVNDALVLHWGIDPAPGAAGITYAIGELSKTISTNENGATSIQYTDLQGRMIQQLVEMETGVFATTHYIYDAFGRVKYVLQPEGYKAALAISPYSLSQSILDDWAFQYIYDARGRVIAKKIPGAGWAYIVYDKLDRAILTQDANLEATDQWLYTKFDILGRPIMTGKTLAIISTGSGLQKRNYLQAGVDAYFDPDPSRLFETIINNSDHGYTNTMAFPHEAMIEAVHSVTYYDDYDFDHDGTADASYSPDPVIANGAPSFQLQGQLTAVKTRVLDDLNSGTLPKDWLWTVTFYDEYGREIQTQSETFYGTDIGTSQVNFAGEIEASHLRHQGPSEAVDVLNRFCYDAQGRPLRSTQRNGDDEEIILSSVSYDELGRNISKDLHSADAGSSFLQNIDYRYNLRDWLTHINPIDIGESMHGTDLFRMQLRYTEGFTDLHANASPLYNGNISGWIWHTALDTEEQGYAYQYDLSDRITEAHYAARDDHGQLPPANWSQHIDDFSVTGLSYDLNGNILGLQRRGLADQNSLPASAILMDDLSYSYGEGNRLTGVEDAVNNTTDIDQFVNGHIATANDPDYVYDLSGNLIEDKNKGITVEYNHFNKPIRVVVSPTQTIEYIYDAAGTKLRQTILDGGNTTTKEYLTAFHYTDQVMEFFQQAEGRVVPLGSGSYRYEYYHKDHLGNTRLSFSDLNGDGNVDPLTEVLQVDQYYPFGIRHAKASGVQAAPEQNYLYNGKELDETFGLDWYDYGFRWYAQDIARFVSVDPLAEDFFYLTTYQYASNSPIWMIDLDGLEGVPAIHIGYGQWATASDGTYNGLSQNHQNFYANKQHTDQQTLRKQLDQGKFEADPRNLHPASSRQTVQLGEGIISGLKEITEDVALGGIFGKIGKGANFAKNLKQLNNGTSVRNTGKMKNKLKFDEDAVAVHSTFKRDKNTDIYKYETYEQTVIGRYRPTHRFDGGKFDGSPGTPHKNSETKVDIPTPHVQGKNELGGVRPAKPEELPNNKRFK
ncbi:MAG: DUF6443 domain-containing protein [Bacteroidota bacterium]